MPGLASKTHVQTLGHESMNLCPKPIAALTARVLLVTRCATVNAVFSGPEHVDERLTPERRYSLLYSGQFGKADDA